MEMTIRNLVYDTILILNNSKLSVSVHVSVEQPTYKKWHIYNTIQYNNREYELMMT